MTANKTARTAAPHRSNRGTKHFSFEKQEPLLYSWSYLGEKIGREKTKVDLRIHTAIVQYSKHLNSKWSIGDAVFL